MLVRYTSADGSPHEFPLTERSITIGRSLEGDIVIQDEKASRNHCGIRFEDGVYYLRDLKSKNGTFLNNERIDTAALNAGDRFRIGDMVFRVEEQATTGPDTALQEVEEQMAHGKGYGTILREIVGAVEESGPKPPPKRRPSPPAARP